MTFIFSLAFSLLLTLSAPGTGTADASPHTPPSDDNARDVFEELDRRRTTIEYESSRMTMIIHSSRGSTRTRELRTWSINRDDESKQLTFFESPADVRDTGLLNITSNGDEHQQVYLPAVGRVQTIGSSERGDRFMGSDFTYEDLGQQNPDNYDFEEVDRDSERILLKAMPQHDSQYDHIFYHIDPDDYLLMKAEYIDHDGNKIKRLEVGEYQNIRDDIWRADYMVMHDLENDRKTELRWEDRTFDEPISADLFTERQLRRGIPR
ncbi:outer membrane lipoprotein-sorting protein [Natronogracilivirga saccharolytica]|uniref:Outer membrane lipoprotein-sorting protein n=1 Tax=Natronogracilivirga saccharolytica TaxID=2812953 RepID=A0A8J7S6R0_9BACT|nr:outer membrane lipoprotein-sorting protein [Natronogracilivirga saccharolytica]MBP3192958.1 outer membrane lipoprotein-sorting protein [Natronogracilivirga saccharolytica]